MQSSLKRPGVCFTIGLFLCILTGFFPVWAGSSPFQGQPAPASNVVEGSQETSELKGNESRTFHFHLKSRSLFIARVSPQRIDVMLRLVGPDGKTLAEANRGIGLYDSEDIFLMCEQPGHYQMVVTAVQKEAPAGKFSLEIKKLHPATPADEVELEVWHLIFESQKFWADGIYDKSLAAAESALAKSEKTFGPEHVLVFKSLYQMGLTCYSKGDFAKAEAVTVRALGIQEKLKEVKPVERGDPLETLGTVYLNLGKFEQAETQLQQVLALREKLLEPDHPNLARAYNNLAGLYWSKNQYAKVEPLLQKSLQINEKVFGPENEITGDSLNGLAALYLTTGKYDLAEPMFRRSIAIQEKKLGPEHPNLAIALGNFAILLQWRGEYLAAEQTFLRVLAIHQKAKGPESKDVAQVLNNLGNLYKDKSELEKAVDFHQRALAIYEKVLGPDHQAVGTSLSNLAGAYHAMGNYQKAEPLYQRGLAVAEKKLGPDNVGITPNLNSLAAHYRDRGNFALAEPLYLRALAIREKVLGPENPDVATPLTNLSVLYRDKGELAKAEIMGERAVAVREKALGPNQPVLATLLMNLSSVYRAKGDYTKGELVLERALAILEKTSGPDHPDTGTTLTNLGNLLKEQGDVEKAIPFYQRALSIFEKRLGPHHYKVGQVLNGLASAYRAKGDFAQAEPLLLRALEVGEKALGPNHPQVAFSLNSLGLFYLAKGDAAKAASFILKAKAINEKIFGLIHQDLATMLFNLGNCRFTQQDYQQAEPLFLESLKIREQVLGPNHHAVADSLSFLAATHQAMGQVEQALEDRIRSNEISEMDLNRNLVSGSERQKSLYLNQTALFTDDTISLHLQGAPHNIKAAQAALTVILRRKGRALDAMTNVLATLRGRNDAETKKLLDEYENVGKQISVQVLKGPGNLNPAEHQAAIQELQKRKEQLEREISRRSLEFQTKTTPITLEGVQALVPTGAALVEYATYRPVDPKTRKLGEPRYAAYLLLKPQGSQAGIQWVDLGPAQEINQLASLFRQALRNRIDAPAGLQGLGRKLDQLVLEPVRKLAGSRRHLLIAPDGELNLVPFAALVDEKNRFAVERFTFTYLTSGRDLLRLQAQIPTTQPPLIVADPDYGEGQGPKLGGIQMKPLARLDETQKEAAAILALFPQARVVEQKDATKEALAGKESPKVLHIATHGYFFEDTRPSLAAEAGQRVLVREDSTSVNLAQTRLENPLLRSYLFFANSNRDSGGIMSALEMAETNLWGTKLVVLSACDTGLGEVKNGEGVYGLRRALVLAGSEAQLMSLWPVSDTGTRELMTEFYSRVKAGAGLSEALRTVQLKMLKNPKRSHPFFWASFIQSGQWGALETKP
ncbi:MAG: tetratricopeptide repeat protein [Blastocatellia bacterium]|nr:tetratricopeptide repeat protein [Blastocatellia bacterium]